MKVKNKKVTRIVGIVLGVVLLFFGGMGLFMEPPELPFTGDALSFSLGLAASGYILPLMNAVFVLTGLSLILSRYVPLMLVVLAPFTFNIVMFHVMHDMSAGALPGVVILILHVYMGSAYLDFYKPMLASGTSKK